MNKQKLVDLLKSPSNIDAKSLDEVAKVVGDNPYFQSGHALLAIGNKKFHSELTSKTVAQAAVYATNRILLKRYLGQNKIQGEAISTLKEEPKKEILAKKEAAENTTISDQTVDAISSKSEESTIIETTEVKEKVNLPVKEPTSIDTSGTPKKYENIDLDKLLSELKDSYRQLQTNMHSFDVADKNLTEATSKKLKSKKDSEKGPDSKITTKKTAPAKSKKSSKDDNPNEVSPSGPELKKKEHKELIDKFIEREPSIKPKKQAIEEGEPIEDLSTKNQVLTDDMVTENLANIMVRQGRHEKAIEVYNKLIWKFPHKKAYFAARIEELKEQ
ncbi:MAG: hypothetical protein O2887_09320 [Bacteroidetes bacterium]|nr:hypothetical protein [Bacteroidota bacterium]